MKSEPRYLTLNGVRVAEMASPELIAYGHRYTAAVEAVVETLLAKHLRNGGKSHVGFITKATAEINARRLLVVDGKVRKASTGAVSSARTRIVKRIRKQEG